MFRGWDGAKHGRGSLGAYSVHSSANMSSSATNHNTHDEDRDGDEGRDGIAPRSTAMLAITAPKPTAIIMLCC